MATKRGFQDVGSPDFDRVSPTPGSFKKRKQHDTKNKHKPNEGSIEYSKKRARNIERLLKRKEDLPADVRNDLERELAAHQETVNEKTFQKRRSTMIAKYHMVRFFERKKAMRLVKQLKRKIQQSTSDEEKEELAKDLHIAEVDEIYTQFYPHAEAYISLYPNAKHEDAEGSKGEGKSNEGANNKPQLAKALLSVERPEMWRVIEKTMEKGPEALKRLRERQSPDDDAKVQKRPQKPRSNNITPQNKASSKPAQQPRAQKPQAQKNGDQAQKQNVPASLQGLNRRERRKLMREGTQPAVVEEDDDDSDGGGFFE